MGKIRVSTIGDENAEQKQKEKAEKKKQAKALKEAKIATPEIVTEPKKETTEIKPKVEEVKKTVKKTSKYAAKQKISKRSKNYLEAAKLIDRNKLYSLSEALDLLPKIKLSSFDETVELHFNTSRTGISGSIVLPHGTGKKTKVAIISPASNAAGADKLLKDIEAGKIDFDILVATPDAMPKLAKVAKILGPKGLMPNPKNGTITTKPEDVAKKYEGGQINYKTEAKMPIIHLTAGKISFGKEKLEDNIKAFITSIQKTNIKKAVLKSTMSVGIKLTI